MIISYPYNLGILLNRVYTNIVRKPILSNWFLDSNPTQGIFQNLNMSFK
jgi:hypothetical protein